MFLVALGLHRWAGFSLAAGRGLLAEVASLAEEHSSRCAGFSRWGMWAESLRLTGLRAEAQRSWFTDLVAPWPVEPSQTRD